MKSHTLKSTKYLNIKVFIALLSTISLVACGQVDTPKIGTREQNNGRDNNDNNGPQKPTPNKAYQVFATTNLLFIGAREAVRTADIALNTNKAKSLNRCQKVDATKDLITVTLRSGCNPSGYGKEEISVVRNSENKITKINLNKNIENRNDIGLEYHTAQNGKNRRVETDAEMKEEIEMTSADGVQFDVTAKITIELAKSAVRIKKDQTNRDDEEKNRKEKAKERNSDSRKNKNSRLNDEEAEQLTARGMMQTFITLTFAGKMDLTKLDEPMLTLTSSSSQLEITKGESRDIVGVIISDLKIKNQKSKTEKRGLICGVADGDFSIEQSVTIDDTKNDEIIETPIQIYQGKITNLVNKSQATQKRCANVVDELYFSSESLSRPENSRRMKNADRYSRFQKPKIISNGNASKDLASLAE